MSRFDFTLKYILGVIMGNNKELKLKVIQLHHDILVVEHKDRLKIIELVIRNYLWPGVIQNVGRYIDKCGLY